MLQSFLQGAIRRGDLRVAVGAGPLRRYGDGSGPEISVRMSAAAAARIALNPDLGLAECYMDGALSFEAGDLYGLLELVAHNPLIWRRSAGPLAHARRIIGRRVSQVNGRRAARRNVAHHYDLSHDLYRRFLDADLQYSCAYFRTAADTLEQAQAAKKAHIVAKLDIRPGMRVLDIGCGWGGLALTLGELGAEVLGITLSQEQLAVSRRRARDAGLDRRVRFELCDYRDMQGRFDRVVSVGMFEHVGLACYPAFFQAVARLMEDDGVGLVHSIGRSTPPAPTQAFIAKYIFPGGYIPSLSQVLPGVEMAGLWATDVEILRLHYAETLRIWRARFHAHRAEIARLYDERFCRMWEFYLVSSEMGFRFFGMMNFQIQLTRKVDALPLTRDYMMGHEEELVARAGESLDLRRHTAAE